MIDTRELAAYTLWDSLVRLCALGHTGRSLEILQEVHAIALDEPDDRDNKIARILEIAMEF